MGRLWLASGFRETKFREPGDPFPRQPEAELFVPGSDPYSETIRWLDNRYPASRIFDVDVKWKNRAVIGSMRNLLVQRYSWAIPSDDVLSHIASLGVPIVEVGAGTGYWASLLSKRGVLVDCYDSNPPPSAANHWHNKARRTWHPIMQGTPSSIDWSRYRNHALFLCWPPYSNPMGFEALRNFQGNVVIYIGESSGGCTGCEDMWNLFGEQWELLDVGSLPLLPQWAIVHDEYEIWRRR